MAARKSSQTTAPATGGAVPPSLAVSPVPRNGLGGSSPGVPPFAAREANGTPGSPHVWLSRSARITAAAHAAAQVRQPTLPVTTVPPTVRFTVPGEPRSKSRHRPGVRGGQVVRFKDEAVARAQDLVGICYRERRGPGAPDKLNGFGVSMIFYLQARQRRDVDNFVKLILDGLTGFAWADDSQVTEISAKIRHGDAEPRSEITVYPTDDLPDWARATCQWCGSPFRTYSSWFGKTHCSRDCSRATLREKRLRPCGHCGQMYDAYGTAKTQRYCSKECASLAKTYEATCAACGRDWRKPVSLRRGGRDYCNAECQARYWRENPSRSTKGGSCETCGAPKSRREYHRCNACKQAARVTA
jgi:Holliday junction resolvase RusA-like endonuclease